MRSGVLTDHLSLIREGRHTSIHSRTHRFNQPGIFLIFLLKSFSKGFTQFRKIWSSISSLIPSPISSLNSFISFTFCRLSFPHPTYLLFPAYSLYSYLFLPPSIQPFLPIPSFVTSLNSCIDSILPASFPSSLSSFSPSIHSSFPPPSLNSFL